MSALGRGILRSDAYSKATGVERYTEDVYPAGMLHGVIVRSPVASARIKKLNIGRALADDRVVKILTAADLPDRLWGSAKHDQPILAREVVRFVGEPVAIVAATSKRVALEAAGLVELELEDLPAVPTLTAALEDQAPEVHAGEPNLQEASVIRRGDVEAAFTDAEHVVATRFESHRVHQAYIEPRAALAEWADGRLIVTMTSQAPFVVRQGLASLLDMPMSQIDVNVPALGGGFGGKLHLGVAPQAAVMCLAVKRPVQIVCSRSEDMHAGNPRENSIIELESAVAQDGTIRARRARVYLDSGAYAMDTPSIASIAALEATGPYEIDALDLWAAPVYTNTCPTGSFRGPSGPQMVAATEAHMEEIAVRLGLSANELRRRNFLRPGARGPSGEPVLDPGITECLDAVEERLDQWRLAAPQAETGIRRGFGLACAWWLTSGAPSAATVALNEDGTVTIYTGATEIGTGAVVSGVAALAAAELGVPVENIRLISGSTRDGPHDSGSKGSRTLYGVGNAVLQATREAVRLLADDLADELEASPADVELRDGRIGIRGVPDTTVTLADAVKRVLNRSGPVIGSGRHRSRSARLEGSTLQGMRFDAFVEPTFHCHGTQIKVELETGRVEVERYVAAHDIGPVLNPVGARGQVEGGVVQGLGYALTEMVDLAPGGWMRNADLVDYRIPTIADVPREIETVFIETHPGPTGPHGAKGVGEAPVILPAAAVGSALRDAFGAQPDRLPFDATRIADFIGQLDADLTVDAA
jgi:CO/xanthine dehydrogenase Mo-binding subunit